MKLSKESLIEEASKLQFQPNNLEKVIRCKKLIAPLFPLRKNEKNFINRLRKDGVIEPQLLTDEPVLSEKIKTHPAILRRAEKAMETLGRKNV